ncbi:MAG: hypothetical protein ACKVOT_14100 [Polaromonas sp.]
MLAASENALLTRLRGHRDIKRLVRTVDTLPKVPSEQLLTKYHADAPALYVVPGRFTVQDSLATMRFTVAGVVRNVRGHEQARKGDGIDIGCDHLITLAIRALNDQVAGEATWKVVAGEMVDDDVFDAAGIAAVEISLESYPIELSFDYGEAELAGVGGGADAGGTGPGSVDELDDFTHAHVDLDITPHAGTAEHRKWLAVPPDFSTSAPDAQLDIQLPGADA